MDVISATNAALLIEDNASIIPGGFGSCGHPDILTTAIEKRFLATGSPRNISLLFASGAGDKQGMGLDKLAHKGLVRKAIGGFWGLCPKLTTMALNNEVEAHNWPQGVISNLFREIAAQSPGVISKVGLGTFVDPKNGGGLISKDKGQALINEITIKDINYLHYPIQQVDIALLRGTVSDEDGNIAFDDEVSFTDSLSQAQAVKNCGGKVIFQVKRIVKNHSISPELVKVPCFLVDYVVIAEDDSQHPQTYGRAILESEYTATNSSPRQQPLAKRIIASRAALELQKHKTSNVNLGIGIPALVGAEIEKNNPDKHVVTVESGVIGGVPEEGLSFGASNSPMAIIEQSSLFNFYDGGGIDVAFLGFAEVDTNCNVNVSRFGSRAPGAGGFINISQSAKKVVFCGTLTAGGLDLSYQDDFIEINQEGSFKKFKHQVEQITFFGHSPKNESREVLFITERAVFSILKGTLTLVELAAGITVDDITSLVDCDFSVSNDLSEMKFNI